MSPKGRVCVRLRASVSGRIVANLGELWGFVAKFVHAECKPDEPADKRGPSNRLRRANSLLFCSSLLGSGFALNLGELGRFAAVGLCERQLQRANNRPRRERKTGRERKRCGPRVWLALRCSEWQLRASECQRRRKGEKNESERKNQSLDF